ncbi:MAG: ATP-binding protein [Acetobacteraceae bacterium]
MQSLLGPVHAEQVRSTYQQLPLTLAVSLLNALLLGLVFSAITPVSHILIWIALVVVLSLIRLGLWQVHRRLSVGSRHSISWSYLATGGAFVSGMIWGYGPFLMFALNEPYQLFLAFVIAGMCAGAATVHAAHFPSVVAFIAPAIFPLTFDFLAQGRLLPAVSGIMMGVFGLSLCVASLKFRQWFRDTTAARLKVTRQTQQMSEVNARLQLEISRHQSTTSKLQQAQKLEAIGQLTAGIAHDFNNLLMAIGGSAGLIASRLGQDPVQGPRLTIILQSVERGATLTRQLLTFGRKQPLTPRLEDINSTLRNMQTLLETTLGGCASLHLRLGSSPRTAFIDVAQLEHAILNLVMNARDAMPNGGVVTIATTHVDLPTTDADPEIDMPAGRFVLVTVSDTGVGMSEEVRRQAFDPFFTTKDVGRGSGLGLSQVYGLIHQSGGVTHITSQPGQGTTVSIYLPVAPVGLPDSQVRGLPKPAEMPKPLPLATSKVDVLLLDDDDQARTTIAAMLRAAGYAVASFAATEPALAEVEIARRPIDLMIVDYAMPDQRGDQFAAQVRELRPNIPIMFVTGYAKPDSLKAEPWLLRKPFDAPTLIAKVNQALQRAN